MGYIGSGPTRFNTADELTVTGDAEITGAITTDGMTTLNGATWGSGDGSIAINDEDDGDITITIKANATSNLVPRNAAVYDVQMLNTSGSVSTLTSANCRISADVTRALS